MTEYTPSNDDAVSVIIEGEDENTASDRPGSDVPPVVTGLSDSNLPIDEPIADLANKTTTELPEGEGAKPLKPATPQLSREDRQAYEQTVRRFQSCGRCGYLLADCRLALGEEALQKAVLAAHDNRLTIEGTEALRPLLVNAFGIRLDQGFDYYDGLCPECRRRYVFSVEETGRTQLQIMI